MPVRYRGLPALSGTSGCPSLSELDVMLCGMPVTVRVEGLGELLDQQFSVVSRRQLLALGMKDNAMQRRVRAGGPWQVLLPGVYLGLTGAPSLPQKEMAALLYAGPGSLITGPAALMYHGLRGPGLLETSWYPPSGGVTASASSGCTARLGCPIGSFRAAPCGSLGRPAP